MVVFDIFTVFGVFCENREEAVLFVCEVTEARESTIHVFLRCFFICMLGIKMVTPSRICLFLELILIMISVIITIDLFKCLMVVLKVSKLSLVAIRNAKKGKHHNSYNTSSHTSFIFLNMDIPPRNIGWTFRLFKYQAIFLVLRAE